MLKRTTSPAIITELSELPPFEEPLLVQVFREDALAAPIVELTGKIDNVEYRKGDLNFHEQAARLILNMGYVDDVPAVESFEYMNMLYYPDVKLAKGDVMTEEFAEIIALNVLRKAQTLRKRNT